MTKITQADRDAAEEHFDLWYPNTAWGYEPLVEAFARHRQYGYDQGYYDGRQADGAKERAKIVAWLRKEAPAALHDPRMVANAIEAREHETFTHPDNV